jgi:hypothetical protein
MKKRILWVLLAVVVYLPTCALGYMAVDIAFRLTQGESGKIGVGFHSLCLGAARSCWLGAAVIAAFVAVWGHRASFRSQACLAILSGAASGATVMLLFLVVVLANSRAVLTVHNMGVSPIGAAGMSALMAYIWYSWERRRMLSKAQEDAGPRGPR